MRALRGFTRSKLAKVKPGYIIDFSDSEERGGFVIKGLVRTCRVARSQAHDRRVNSFSYSDGNLSDLQLIQVTVLVTSESFTIEQARTALLWPIKILGDRQTQCKNDAKPITIPIIHAARVHIEEIQKANTRYAAYT